MQHFQHRIWSGSVENASVQGGGGGRLAGARVGVALSGGSACISGCADKVGDDGGKRGGSSCPTGEPANKSEDAGVETGGGECTSRLIEESAGESDSGGVESSTCYAANLSVEPGGFDQQAITAVPLWSQFSTTARPRTCA